VEHHNFSEPPRIDLFRVQQLLNALTEKAVVGEELLADSNKIREKLLALTETMLQAVVLVGTEHKNDDVANWGAGLIEQFAAGLLTVIREMTRAEDRVMIRAQIETGIKLFADVSDAHRRCREASDHTAA
jgi:hypothetical protein